MMSLLKNSVIISALSKSVILSFLMRRMPLVSGCVFGLLLAVPHNRFNNEYSLIAVLFLSCLLLSGITSGRVKSPGALRLGWFTVLYWVIVLAAGLTSLDFALSLRFMLFHLTAFLALVITYSVLGSGEKNSWRNFITPVLVSVTLGGLYGLLQSRRGVAVVASQVDVITNNSMPGRIYAFYDNPNNFAGILVLTLPFFAALFFTAKTQLGKRAVLIAALPPVMALLLTFSRSGWMAFGFALVIFFYFTYRWVVPVIFAGAFAAFALPVLPSTITDRIISTFTGSDSSISYRSFVSETYMSLIKTHWFSGMGPGSDVVRENVTAYYTTKEHYEILWWQIASHAHSLYLQLWAEIGIVGVAAFCAMMIFLLKKTVVTVATSAQKNFFAAAGLASLAGILLMGYAEYIWFYPRVQLLFWIVVGITISSIRPLSSPSGYAAQPACEAEGQS
jgi:O-antigen ligase